MIWSLETWILTFGLHTVGLLHAVVLSCDWIEFHSCDWCILGTGSLYGQLCMALLQLCFLIVRI